MIPILYAPTETTFTHNGIGVLSETLSCFVTEARNGGFECEFTYPINGRLYSEIEVDCIVKAKANDASALQLFRIFKHSKPISGIVTFYAEHISYELSKNPIEEVSVQNANAQTALNAVLTEGLFRHSFTAQSDIDTLNSISLSFVSIRAALGGVQGSILDTYGGEYEFDNYTVKLHRRRGTDTGIKIAYGKNLIDVKQEKNISSVYTAVYPYAKYTPASEGGEEQRETTVTLEEKIIFSQYAANYATVRVYMKDFSDTYGDNETPTEATLRAKAQAWVNTSGFDIPSVSITVSFKHLWKSPEYAEYALLERVSICDTVTVEYTKLGVSATAKVIKTKYNTLKEDYESLELGDAKANFADTFNLSVSEIKSVKKEIASKSQEMGRKLTEAISNATALITGQNGGYVVLNPSNNPQEILIMDTPNIETAVNVWRWNSAGLGHSSNGYNGPYTLAMTMDGHIVANTITAGELDGIILKAGSITAEAISAAYKNSVIDAINSSQETVEQEFAAADGRLISSILQTLSDYSTTSQMSSAITQTAEEIALTVTAARTYSEQLAMNAENAANSYTNEQLTAYPTSEEMSSAITQTAEEIALTVTAARTYSEQLAMNAENAANSYTNEQLENYATTEILTSEITQLANRISLVVTSSTSGGSAINSASIIAAINDDTSSVTVEANKINLTAYAKSSDVYAIACEATEETINGITINATNGSTSSVISVKYNGVTIDSTTVEFNGAVTFSDLETAGNTVINGANIMTDTITADAIGANNGVYITFNHGILLDSRFASISGINGLYFGEYGYITKNGYENNTALSIYSYKPTRFKGGHPCYYHNNVEYPLISEYNIDDYMPSSVIAVFG